MTEQNASMVAKITRACGIVVAYAALGYFFGAVAATMYLGGVSVLSLHFGIWGVPVGLLCAPAGVVLFRRKELRRACSWLVVITTPLVMIISLLRDHLFLVMAMSGAAFLVVHVVVASRLPDVVPPGCCRSCGYDLTGNASGRCSECGRVVESS